MIERGRTAAARALRSHWTVAAIVFALLAIVHTWPLATEPGTLSRNDNGDAQLNEWIVAWIAHQLPRDPLRLFQGNIFYPGEGRPRVLGAADRAGADGGAGVVAGRLAGAGDEPAHARSASR